MNRPFVKSIPPSNLRWSTQKTFLFTVLSVLSFTINTKAAIPDAAPAIGSEATTAAPSSGVAANAANNGMTNSTNNSQALLGKWMKLEQIQNVKTVGLDGTVYKGVCSEDEVSLAFSFNSQQIGDAPSSPILTSHPQLCARLDFNSVMYFPAENASLEKINGSPEEIVLAQVEGHPAIKNLDGGKSTMHVVRGVRVKANCEMRSRSKMMGMMTDTLMDCKIAEGGTGTLTFLVN